MGLTVASNDAQPRATVMGCKVDIGAILKQQNQVLFGVATQRLIPMPIKDRRGRQPVAVRLINQSVIPFHRGFIASGGANKRLRRAASLDFDLGDQPSDAADITNIGSLKLSFDPVVAAPIQWKDRRQTQLRPPISNQGSEIDLFRTFDLPRRIRPEV